MGLKDASNGWAAAAQLASIYMGVALLLLLVRNMPLAEKRRRRRKNHFVLLIQDADAFFEQHRPARLSRGSTRRMCALNNSVESKEEKKILHKMYSAAAQS